MLRCTWLSVEVPLNALSRRKQGFESPRERHLVFQRERLGVGISIVAVFAIRTREARRFMDEGASHVARYRTSSLPTMPLSRWLGKNASFLSQ